jgi:predicted TIM-barrel fold metal-dependent hydrolase
MQRKLADMDSAGIDVAVLSLGIPGPELLGGAEADEVARLVNDALAEIIAQHPDPYGPWRRPIQLLDELGCTESEREQMRHGNAQRLFLP